MDAARWDRLQQLFHSAADLAAHQQQALLQSACAGDPSLLSEVSAMLAADAAPRLEPLPAELTSLATLVFDDEEAEDLYLGRTFGPYHFKSRLGQGGMGWVYLAERPDYEGIVAIKVLRDALSPERRLLFDYEKKLLAQLTHPSIARLYDAGILDDGAAFFAMEYVDGLPITTFCRVHALDLRQRITLFCQVCEAVMYAHGRGIIHRDLKPSNILTRTEHAEAEVKLLDFGVSERVGQAEAGLAGHRDDAGIFENAGSSYMTLAYCAPEQILYQPADVQADIYSLGVILQQLLTGHLPYDLEGKSREEVRALVLHSAPRRPSTVAPSADSPAIGRSDWHELDAVCIAALARDRAQRYSSVEGLTRDLARFLEQRPLECRKQHSPYAQATYEIGKYVQRNRGLVLAATVALCLVVGLVSFYTFRLHQARNAALAEVARTGRLEHFLDRLLTGDDEQDGPSYDLRVVTVLERGVRDARALDNDKPIQAELYQTLGSIYADVGKYDTAEPLLQAALQEQTALYGADSADAAYTLVTLGVMRDAQGNQAEGETMVRRALAVDRRLLKEDDPRTVEAGLALATILDHRGAYAESAPLLSRIVELETGKAGAETYLSDALGDLSIIQSSQGHTAEAVASSRRALELDRRIHGEDNPDIAEDLLSIASLDEQLGDYAKAEAEERNALKIEQRWFHGQDQFNVAGAMTALGQTLNFESKYAEARTLVLGSLDMRLRLHEAPNNYYAATWNALGRIDMNEGDPGSAKVAFTHALAMYREVFKDGNYRIGIALSNLGSACFELRDYPAAEKSLQQAVTILTALLAGDSKTATAQVRYARVLVAERRYSEAEHLFLDAYSSLSKKKTPVPVDMADMGAIRGYLATLHTLMSKPYKTAS